MIKRYMKIKGQMIKSRTSQTAGLVCVFRGQAWQRLLKVLVISFCILLISFMGLAACAFKSEHDFPQVPDWPAETGQAELPGNETSDGGADEQPARPLLPGLPEVKDEVQLTAALPFGEDALEMIRLYFLASHSDSFSAPDAITADHQETYEYLRLFDAPLSIRLESVSLEQGISSEQTARWAAANNMPDIFYGFPSFSTLSQTAFLDMSPYLADTSWINPDQLHAPLLKAGRRHQMQIALPFLATAPVLYAQQDFCRAQRISLPDQDWTWQDFARLLDILQQHLVYLDQDMSVSTYLTMTHDQDAATTLLSAGRRVVLANPLSMAEWLPAQFDSSLQWMGFDPQDDFAAGQTAPAAASISAYRQRNPASSAAADILETLTAAGLSSLHVSQDIKESAGFTQAFIQNNQALLWFDDSSRLPYWMQLRQFQVTPLLLPVQSESPVPVADMSEGIESERPVYADDDWLPYLHTLMSLIEKPRLPVQLRMLSVSAQSAHPEIASRLAATIALDSHSLMLQSRYQLYEGYMPVVRDEAVWDVLVGRQVYGYRLRSLEPLLSSAVPIGALGVDRQSLVRQIQSDWSQALFEITDSLPLRRELDIEDDETAE